MNRLIKTIDGSYFVPNNLTTYEKEDDGTYKVVVVTEIGNGFNKHITQEEMELILTAYANMDNDKETPRYPYLEGDGYADGLPAYDNWQCPRCGEWYEAETEKYDYCPNCGQHINWNEYKEDMEDE